MRSNFETAVRTILGGIVLSLVWASQTAASPSLGAVTLPSDVTTTTDDRSLFEKVGDFASDNATWFIIGIIAIAVILAVIFILRGRNKGSQAGSSVPPKGAATAAVSPAAKSGQGTPSAAEIKRRRRAAMQRAREEERLRRKAGLPSGAKPAQALDPVAAEKQAAKAGTAQAPTAPTPPVSPEAPTEVSPAPGSIAAGGAAAAAGAVAAGAIGSGGRDDEAEERLRAKVEEIKAGQAAVAPPPTPAGEAPLEVPGRGPEALAGGMAAGAVAAGSLEGREAPTPPVGEAPAVPTTGATPVPEDLAQAEARIRADREARDRSLAEAEQRLRLVEERAAAAERRAAFAEQLAELKAEEGEQERRLREVLERMDRAEERARQAELRAEAAERVASDALRGGAPAASPEPAAAPVSPPGPRPPVEAPSGSPVSPGIVGSVNINTASFEELRGADFSVTQATRVLAYRERFGGYSSVDDLARVPGFSPEAIAALRDRISI